MDLSYLWGVASGFIGTSALVAVALFLGKKWVEERIKNSIENEYATKLEAYKAELQMQNSLSLREMERTYQDLSKQREADRTIFQEFLQKFPPNGVIRFFGNELTGSSFSHQYFNDLDDFCVAWSDPTKEFLDPDLEEARKRLYQSMLDLRKFLAIKTFTLDSNRNGIQPELMEKNPEEFHKRVKMMHDLGTKTYEDYVEFVKLCRSKLNC